MRNRNFIVTFFGLLLLGICSYIVLNGNPDTQVVTETAKEIGQDTVKEAKSGIRKIQDATCEMIDGKVECAAQEAKHKAQDAADEMEDKLN